MRTGSNSEIKYTVTILTGEEWTRGPGTPPTVKGPILYTGGSRSREESGL